MLVRKLITAPAAEPISVIEAKAHCRVTHDEHDDTLFPQIIKQAREHLENLCSRAFITQQWDVYYDQFPGAECLRLPLGKLQTVDVFEWTDSVLAANTWTVSGTNLLDGATVRAHIDAVEEPAQIKLAYSQMWPTDTLKTSNPIRIRFTCGYGVIGETVPYPLRAAMLLLIDHWYTNTPAVLVGAEAAITSKPLLMGVDALIANYRLHY